jgi:hypothetical protein
MNRKIRICCVLTYLCVATSSCGAASNESQRIEEPPVDGAPNGIDAQCLSTIEKHVERTRKWSRDSYKILSEELSSNVRGFAVIERSDAFINKGDRKSFHIDLDRSCSKVVRELKYQ